MMEVVQFLVLVPNHLSTHKLNKNQALYHTRIRYYSLFFRCFFAYPLLFIPTTWVEEKKRVAVRRKKVKRSAEYHTTDGTGRKVGWISTPIPNHLSTLISTSMPNHLSTPHSRHQSLIICLPINFTIFTTHFLVSMTVREGWK